MVKITFPDGSVEEFKEGVTGVEVARHISEGLAKQAVALYVNEVLQDLNEEIKEDCEVKIVTAKNEESVEILRHTTAHVFAQALLRLFPEAKIAIGPPIENGFYYDVDLDSLEDDHLPQIEEEMWKIIKEDLPVEIEYKTKEQAMEFFKDNSYKRELIDAITSGNLSEEEKAEGSAQGNLLKFYKQGEFQDICTGPHLPRTGMIKAFKLDKVTRAYWRGNADNKQLMRIYGTVFWKKSELDEYYRFLEEAKKRDHRLIGRQMGLFSISDYAPGMPFFHNNGMIVWDELLEFWKKVHKRENYEMIKTPIMMSKSLWEVSGHWANYRDDMYVCHVENEEYAVKPMNCPGGILIYKERSHSYKELPLRSGEIGLVHRHELSGTLSGLFRVRCFHQDDAHIFMREDQIKDEILGVLNLIDEIYTVFGLDYHLELSTRPEKSIGSDEAWEKTTEGLKNALEATGKDYKINPGDGAFYGPKIDVNLTDAIGRTHQCGTIQLDMNLPERFGLSYVTENNEKVRPVMIHRVIYGSIERFLGILIEHFEGKFPLWLSPVQVMIINVADRHKEYCEEIRKKLEAEDFRVRTDYEAHTVSNKIRLAREKRPNYMMILGDKDLENGTVSVRDRNNETSVYKPEDFIEMVKKERDNKEIK